MMLGMVDFSLSSVPSSVSKSTSRAAPSVTAAAL